MSGLCDPIVQKKGDKTHAVNYRPISLTCIVCKVLEHIMASQIVKHMKEHSLLYDLQHGFREKRSCETQLTMLVEDLARNASKGKQTELILLDFSKAFDKVNHSKLIWKLHQYGIRSNVLRWVHAFLSNRSQSVVVGVRNQIRCRFALVYPRALYSGRFSSSSTSTTSQIL